MKRRHSSEDTASAAASGEGQGSPSSSSSPAAAAAAAAAHVQWEAVSFKLLGVDPVPSCGYKWVSDHFGVQVDFELVPALASDN